MPRKKPFSAKQKKAQLQHSRATKRGDEDVGPAPAPKPTNFRHAPGRSADPTRGDDSARARALESRFVSLPPAYLDRTRDLAFATTLIRPIPLDFAVFPLEAVVRPEASPLNVPCRPKFRHDQTKKEVERNEEGMFKKWIANTRTIVEDWVVGDNGTGWPRSPSWFETNLEVWRQLWRVTEVSSIVLLLIDSRCPPLHCPPSLRAYLRALIPRKQVILVLTKADLVDPSALSGWRTWLHAWWTDGTDHSESDSENVQVVCVTSYDVDLLHGPGPTRHRPAIPSAARAELIAALKRAHGRLLKPPQAIADDPERLSKWSPPVRSAVDWEALDLEPKPFIPNKTARSGRSEATDETEVRFATDPLTIGLVGQPNVGKSSLLNAILGTTRVRASKTPGKTKHFQTILWGPSREVKIVDCPGLVCPSLVPMELQAMAGILPISQIPSLPSCIHLVATRLPLEEVFHVPRPPDEEVAMDTYASKRTWRGDGPRSVTPVEPTWTAGGILEARALDRGFLTAKGGRPDTNRAGNAMLRAIADGRVRWGFWPPGSPDDQLASTSGRGVWLGDGVGLDDEAAPDGNTGGEGAGDATDLHSSDSDQDSVDSSEDNEDEDEEESMEEDGFAAANKRSFFAALDFGEDDDDDEKVEE